MNNKPDPNLRRLNRKITEVINVVVIYAISGALIVYGGVNVSLNFLQLYRGMYAGQWYAALPLVLIFGLVPIILGIMLLIFHPATRTQPASGSKAKAK